MLKWCKGILIVDKRNLNFYFITSIWFPTLGTTLNIVDLNPIEHLFMTSTWMMTWQNETTKQHQLSTDGKKAHITEKPHMLPRYGNTIQIRVVYGQILWCTIQHNAKKKNTHKSLSFLVKRKYIITKVMSMFL